MAEYSTPAGEYGTADSAVPGGNVLTNVHAKRVVIDSFRASA
ncbi:hypothetical protein ACQP25_33775 [Microtetraspora malaysiensis]